MTNDTFLTNINWLEHDGVNLPMINDFLRNQFYDTIIKNNVAGHDCIDIGFGNGLLSMMAIAHGAKSVTAFESESNRFLLAKLVVEKLNLQDKIHLVNERFDYSKLEQYPTVDVIFHETLDSNAWKDGLFKNLPQNSNIRFLPNEYKLELIAAPIPTQFATVLLNPVPKNIGFNPGVDVSSDFIKLINEIGFPEYSTPPELTLPPGLIKFDFERETLHGWQLALKWARSIQIPSAWYSINSGLTSNTISDRNGTKTIPIDFEMIEQTLVIDTSAWKDQIVLVVPRFNMIDDNTEMMLDTGHWGFLKSPIMLVNPKSDLKVTHNLHNGELIYNLI